MSSPLRVAVTLEQLWHRVPGGTGAAAIGSIRALQAHTDLELVGVSARHRQPPPPAWAPPIEVHQLPLPRLALYESWHRLRQPPVQWASGPVDVIHVTGMAMPPRSAPLVVTVHDLAFLHDPQHFTTRGVDFFNRAVDLARLDADVVICPSQATLDECVTHGFDPQRLRLVPWGVNAEVAEVNEIERVRRTYGLGRRYVFGAGTIEPRKNLATLIEAFARLDLDDVDLVLAGPIGWGDDVLAGAEALAGRVHLLGFVPSGDLAPLYAGASVFCYPSIREGFGLPVLEAMAQGTPVVTSLGTSTEEVMGSAEPGALVEPRDVAGLTSALEGLLGNDERRRAASGAAQARAAEFSWERTAHALSSVYHEAAGATRPPRARRGPVAVPPTTPARAGTATAPLRVAVNLLWLVPGVVGGSEEYTTRLLRELSARLAADAELDLEVTLFVNRRFPVAHPELVELFRTEVAPVQGTSKVLRILAESTWLAARTGRSRFAMVHHMGGIVPFVRRAPAIVTVHDLQPLALPENFSTTKRWFNRITVPYAARKAQAITTVSAFTRDDLAVRLGVDTERVAIVVPGARPRPPHGHEVVQAVTDRYGLGCNPFFVYPAITYPHKNHRVLIDAMSIVVTTHPEAKLVLTSGAAQCEDDIMHAVHHHGLDDAVRRVGRIPASDLEALYEGACALVFPSIFEGFGLPVLEAMQCCLPVLAASRSALVELVDGAGVLLEPDDPAAWAAAMVDVLDDPGSAQRLSQAGRARAAAASWDRSVDVLVAVYRSVAVESRR
jgi:glycosyltransferase involved in cell wall biosynthesis